MLRRAGVIGMSYVRSAVEIEVEDMSQLVGGNPGVSDVAHVKAIPCGGGHGGPNAERRVEIAEFRVVDGV
jgi:hypothetical protein